MEEVPTRPAEPSAASSTTDDHHKNDDEEREPPLNDHPCKQPERSGISAAWITGHTNRAGRILFYSHARKVEPFEKGTQSDGSKSEVQSSWVQPNASSTWSSREQK